MAETVIVTETINDVIVSSPGLQGPAGRTILNGSGAPSNNFGATGDFYYDTTTTRFYGPKPSDVTWVGAQNYLLNNPPTDYSYRYSWELSQVTGPVSNIYSVVILHNLGFYPNVTVKTSAGDILETGIDYNNTNQITLTMAQPFSGTANLS
jgi:hypothetical protein